MRVLVCCLLAGWAATALAANPLNSLQNLQSKHRELQQQFRTDLEGIVSLAASSVQEDVKNEVQHRLEWLASAEHRRSPLPKEVLAEVPLSLPAEERAWRMQLRKAETDYAQQLYLLSRRVLYAKYPGFAFQLVREAATFDPDHSQARRVLGFVRHGNEWVTPFAARMLKQNNVWHDRFGWLPRSSVERYNAGERQVNGRWMTIEQEAEVRRDFRYAWQIRTDHYLVKTNYDLEEGVRLAVALEAFHDAFHELFAGFFNTPEQMEKMFQSASAAARQSDKPFVVHFYREKAEYVARLERDFPQIAATNGFYQTNERIVHFFHDPMANNEATLFHEATHQLFYECHPGNRQIGETAHFWVIEGIACYMESFQERDGSITLGNPGYIRFAGARHNALNEGYYVPLRELAGMGTRDFQSVPMPALASNYTQSAGMAWFLMDYEEGRYREFLVDHLTQLYSPIDRVRLQAAGLDDLIGVDYEELDRQYLEFLKAHAGIPVSSATN